MIKGENRPIAGPAAAEQSAWWVLHTRARQEKAVARDLDSLKIKHFLPLVENVRYYGRRKQRVQLPLFPGYVFLHGSVEQAWVLDRADRLAQIIEVHNQAQLDQEIAAIQQVLASGHELDPHPYLHAGMRVAVRSGPLKGVQGVIERKRGRNRLVLQIEVLGVGSSLEIDGSLLEPAEDLAIAV